MNWLLDTINMGLVNMGLLLPSEYPHQGYHIPVISAVSAGFVWNLFIPQQASTLGMYVYYMYAYHIYIYKNIYMCRPERPHVPLYCTHRYECLQSSRNGGTSQFKRFSVALSVHKVPGYWPMAICYGWFLYTIACTSHCIPVVFSLYDCWLLFAVDYVPLLLVSVILMSLLSLVVVRGIPVMLGYCYVSVVGYCYTYCC